MYDSGKIITGLIIFAGVVTFPFWYNVGRSAPPPEPKIDTPIIQQLQEKQCVETTSYMRSSHMQLLNNWRTWVVRDGHRIYVADNGKRYNMSLQNTCLRCHLNKKDFCDRCHDYLGVKPDCWSCHIEPKGEKQ